jgi:hypothetical protein
MWGEPLNTEDFKELFSDYVEEQKIHLKSEPTNLYQVVKSMTENRNFYSRILLVTKLKESENISMDHIKESILDEVKEIIEKPFNIMLVIIGAQFCLILIEVSFLN